MWLRNKKRSVRRRVLDAEDGSDDNALLRVNARVLDQKRVRTYRAAVIVLVVAVLAGAFVLANLGFRSLAETLFSKNMRYTVRALNIKSDGSLITADLVKDWTGLRAGMNLFDVDIGRVRDSLLQNAPMIKAVEIGRHLPDTLDIALSERIPVARLEKHGAGYLGVDKEGCVFGLRAIGQTLPTVLGYRGGAVRPGGYVKGSIMTALEVMDVCNKTPVGEAIKVAFADVSHDDHVLLYLAGGECVRLRVPPAGQMSGPDRQDLEERLRTLIQTLHKAADRGKRIAWIDLTFTQDYVPAQEYQLAP